MDEFLGVDGWLVPGRHEVALEEIEAAFVPADDARRVSILRGMRVLVSECAQAWGGGVLLIAGDFVSRHPGPVSRPTIVIVPDTPGDAEDWAESQWERVRAQFSLADVIVGSLGPDYVPVVYAMSGTLDVLFALPEDVDTITQLIGAVTMSDGSDVLGARGVLEVGW